MTPATTALTPPGRLRRLAATVAAGLLLATGLVVGEASPQAANAAACSGSTGVTVIVDNGSLGGGTTVACALGDPTSGLTALTGAGFSYAFVPRFPGFICRINSLPNPCNGAPATAYWSYWHATPGGTWSYSGSGAGSYNPAPGTVEGWAFGAGTAPSVAP
ncbi:hypothetical protein F4553_005996 [Allocatelliglobosispora scoriae]|uniref:Flagellar hook-length control protein FliK n=1 Tax=Allocatelliglobosispora scoriae TaxID=643052 RepID=A0A841C0I4_9ACTN|nr:hypothetical protein [Allocatelliglobosispora scoriae]MBB5872562.1 hypothetical protein [Allocatelliglobosispora scoriae]